MAKLCPLASGYRRWGLRGIALFKEEAMREELDFKSLRFFSALYRLGNVSPAAEALNISQPTGSLLLKNYAIILTILSLCASDNG